MGSNLSDLSTDKKNDRGKTSYVNQAVSSILGVAQGLLFNPMSRLIPGLSRVKTQSLH